MYKCPDNIEELKELEQLIPMCRKELCAQADAMIESGAALSIKDASRKLGEETGKNPESIRRAIMRERADRGVTLSHLLGDDLTGEVLKDANESKKIKREEARESRDEEFTAKQMELPKDKFSLIYIDPPWRYEFSKSDSREIENQYPTMTLDEIKNLPVSELAADDCVMLMWSTSPKLEEAMEVIKAYGFTYKTCAVWDKQSIGMGYYFRQQHELLLVATRGNPPTPDPSVRVGSMISAPRGKHSEKPKVVYYLLEQMFPNNKKVELFARTKREGWKVWGYEAD